MARVTRLQANPARRIQYAERDVATKSPSDIHEVSANRAVSRSPPRDRPVQAADRRPHGAIIKPELARTKPKSTLEATRRKARVTTISLPERRECCICATTKVAKRSFPFNKDVDTCKHFQEICKACIQNLLKSKVTDNRLEESHLACPFPKCKHILNDGMLQNAVTKASWSEYEKALTNHFLATDSKFLSCLSSKCGRYFNREGCMFLKGHYSRKGITIKIKCPYCEESLCMACNRPHGNTSCDQVKQEENRQSEETVKKIGAKPCPKCGTNIEKIDGCNHMTCRHCKHHFCFGCLIPYHGGTREHKEGCPDRVRIINDPRNFAPANMNGAQILGMVEQVHGNPQHQPPVNQPGNAGAQLAQGGWQDFQDAIAATLGAVANFGNIFAPHHPQPQPQQAHAAHNAPAAAPAHAPTILPQAPPPRDQWAPRVNHHQAPPGLFPGPNTRRVFMLPPFAAANARPRRPAPAPAPAPHPAPAPAHRGSAAPARAHRRRRVVRY